MQAVAARNELVASQVGNQRQKHCMMLPSMPLIAAATNSFAIPLFLAFTFVIRETSTNSGLKAFQQHVARSTLSFFCSNEQTLACDRFRGCKFVRELRTS